MTTLTPQQQRFMRRGGCPAGDGGCEDMKENTKMTREIHAAIVGGLNPGQMGWAAMTAYAYDNVRKAKSMAMTANIAFMSGAVLFIWGLITHTIKIGSNP